MKKLHPFLLLMLVALGVLLLWTKVSIGEVPAFVGDAFAGAFKSIGLVIILGALIGALLEKTGAAIKLADCVVKLVGPKHPALALELMGWVVSIPVFCDSGFVILNPIRKAIVQKTGASSVSLTLALAAGLVTSHVFLPPTPGPIAAAQTLGIGEHLLLVTGLGALVSIPALAAALVWSIYAGKKIHAADETDAEARAKSYDALVASYGKLPSAFDAFAPLLLPIVLMAGGSIVAALKLGGGIGEWSRFFGSPLMALACGTILAFVQLAKSGKIHDAAALTEETLKTVGPILFITAAGGVLGKAIAATPLVEVLREQGAALKPLGLAFPFLLAAALKTAQGSSTVAIITTAGITAPLLAALGFNTPVQSALLVLAIGAGSLVVSHANDSYFWVVTKFGGLTAEQGYRTQTPLTAILGVSAFLGTFLLSFVLG